MDMMKAAGDVGMKWMTDVCSFVLNDDKIPEDCRLLLNVYKGKEDLLTMRL